MATLKSSELAVQSLCRRAAELLRERGIAGAVAYCAGDIRSLPARVRSVVRNAIHECEPDAQIDRLVEPKSDAGGIVRLEHLLLTVTPSVPAGLHESEPRHHTELVESTRHEYQIVMKGQIDGESTRDPVGYWAFEQYWEPNLYVRVENIGEVLAVNPWLRRKDMADTRSVQAIVDSLVTPTMSDCEKARRIWEFEIKNRFHATSNDEEVDDAVKRFNSYGYTLCHNESKIISDLWRAAGLKVRRGFPNGHSTVEVYYDGAWHLLDSDDSTICLLRDNKTIASEAHIVADHDLMKRTHNYSVLHFEDRFADERSAALHSYEGKRSDEHRSLTKHRMDFVLRPGEAITWAWNPGGRFHGKEFGGVSSRAWIRRWHLAEHVMNGELSYSPDLSSPATLRYLETLGLELRQWGVLGAGLYATARCGSVILPVESPYPIVGGRLKVDFARADLSDQLKAYLSFDNGKNWQEAGASYVSDYARLHIDLNDFFPAAGSACYRYLLRLDLLGNMHKPSLCLKGLHLRSTLQMARLALPSIGLGENSFVYTDQSGPGRKVRVTHVWRECPSAEVPEQPQAALYPADGGTADGTRIHFRWLPPTGGAPATDYEFQLSEYPDLRWVLSPNFHRLISRTANRATASYELPYRGLLNPGDMYYWRVRARSREGVWGPWSRVFSFSAVAPAVPLNLRARFHSRSRTVTLSWNRGRGGAKPERYRVYGSAERGFSANETAYQFYAGHDGTRDSPPNLLLDTNSQMNCVLLPAELWRAYYRVTAVDEAGRESGPSDMAELTHPLILTRGQLPDGRSGAHYQAMIEVSASVGHLVSADKDGQGYDMRFRTADEIRFALSGAPEGLAIGRESGLLAGYLPADAAQEYDLLVRVTDLRTGVGDSVVLSLNVRDSTTTTVNALHTAVFG